MASGERGTPRRSAPKVWLFLFAVAALCCVRLSPARAQAHVHQWTAYSAPKSTMTVSHIGGLAVDATHPAQPCEVLQINSNSGSLSDLDYCIAPGCPGPNPISDPQCHVIKYDDQGAAGHFGTLVGGRFQDDEFTDPSDNKPYGNADANYYRVGREEASGNTVSLRVYVDDSGQGMSSSGIIPTFDDPPAWSPLGTFPVSGTKCAIQSTRSVPAEKCSACAEASAQRGNSEIVPYNGNLSFTVPITSWGYRGERIPFSLTYNSLSCLDTSLPHQIPDPAALSDSNLDDNYNPKWTHPYAQYIEVVGDGHATWHRADGSEMAFAQSWNGQSGPFWTSDESYHTLTSAGSATSPGFSYQGETTYQTVPYGQFTLVDGDETTYVFSQVRWNTAGDPPYYPGYAIPYFLLSSITDRWGRMISVNWGEAQGTLGVTSVLDGSGRGLTFDYNSYGLISAIHDPAGRTHSLTYTLVAQPDSSTQPKLTGITVLGAGSTNRATYNWSFSYANGPGYSGTYTGDLITQKTEPDGKVVSYTYEAVTLPRAGAGDWDGRFKQSSYTDDLELPASTTRTITRSGNTLTYPGGDRYTYTYSGDDLIQVTRTATGGAVYYQRDDHDNLTTFRTSEEPSPLVTLAYTYSGQQITSVQATDILGNVASASFNSLNLPTTITAKAPAGSGHADQTTQLTYDGGGALSVGNLTQVVAALGTASQDTTTLAYGSTTYPGMPTSVTDSVGAISSVAYNPDGSLASSTSPQNLVAPSTDPDRASSVETLTETTDELPYQLTDPMGHQVTVSYNAESAGSSRLVVTFTHAADSSTRSITLDAGGRVVKSVDEAGVVTQVDYNRAGQAIRVTQALGTSVQRVTTFYHDAYGNLAYFDPPGGSGGRVTYEYGKYNQGLGGTGAPQVASPAVYQGQVTRIVYPDGTSEYFGYNAIGEVQWRYSQDGHYTNFHYDSLHRLYQVDYPTIGSYSGFSVSASFDEFGRTTQTTDASGASLYTYDDLNRLTGLTPGVGLPATYAYTPDTINHRWITKVSLSVVGQWQFFEDTKGRPGALEKSPLGQLTTRKFDLDGKVVEEDRPNGTSVLTSYTSRDWLGGIQHKLAGGSVLDTLNYYYTDASGVYDPTGHLRREVDAGGRTHAFSYNALYELTSETHPDFGTNSYTHDLNGNRTQWTAFGSTSYAGYDAQNKLLWTNGANAAPTSGQAGPYRLYTYDANGQPTRIERRPTSASGVSTDTLSWDGQNELRHLSTTGATTGDYTATYSADGIRASATLNSVAHTYSYGAGLLFDQAGSTIYTPGVSQHSLGVDTYFHQDWLSSTRYLSDSTGSAAPTAYRFNAYGNLSAAAGPDSTSRRVPTRQGRARPGAKSTRATRPTAWRCWESGTTTRWWGGFSLRTRSGTREG